MQGFGVWPNVDKSFYWFESAALQGDARSQYAIGIFYSGFKIIGVTDTTFTIKSYSSSIDMTTLDRLNGKHLRFIKENTSSKTIMGNFNSNKVVFNGDKTDLENELLYLKGSIPGSKNTEVVVRQSVKNISKMTISEKIIAAEEAKKTPDKKKK